MEKITFDNPLRQQCLSLPDLARLQVEGVRLGLTEAVPDEVMKKIRRVIITGCGDSYVAALASIPAFRKFAGRFGSEFSYARAIDVTRFMDFSKFDSENTLVIGVSCSGGSARIQEALRRTNHYGCVSLALTNNPDSPAAQEAAYTFLVHTPAFPNANPGLRNYFASLTGLYLLAAKLGEITGCSALGTVEHMGKAIVDNTMLWAAEMERIDQQMFILAQNWRNFRSFDYIGDDIQFASAFFMAAKVVETTGYTAVTDDSENWCHTGFFQKNPVGIGTVVVAAKKVNDRSRIGETLLQASSIKRPLLLISDGNLSDFGDIQGVTFCQVPSSPEEYDFLFAMMNYVPGAILAGYLSTLNGESFFRGGGIWSEPGNNTIRSSKIRIM